MCVEKGKANWEELLAGMVGASVSWFPRWKEEGAGVLCSNEGFPNIPLMGTRGCINYNPILAIGQLGYPMKAMQKCFRESEKRGIHWKEKIRCLGEAATISSAAILSG